MARRYLNKNVFCAYASFFFLFEQPYENAFPSYMCSLYYNKG